ncbi:MAG: hypothetical protein JNM93_08595 [Bacteriovoracaceae bacterium]|nr:hypothetical protein [Bacteriovoracaceae bacterium]
MYKFKIESLNCMSCFYNIEDILKEYDKEVKAQVDVKNRLLIVESKKPRPELSRLIEKAGYPISSVSES